MSFTTLRSTRSSPLAEINITPLVDVMLTVLVIFMITAPMLTQKMLVPLQGTGSTIIEPRVLGVSIDEFGQLRLDDHAVSLPELDAQVAQAQARAYAEAEAADRRFRLAEEALSITLDDAKAAFSLVEEGREPKVRAIQAESEAAGARAVLDEAQAEQQQQTKEVPAC